MNCPNCKQENFEDNAINDSEITIDEDTEGIKVDIVIECANCHMRWYRIFDHEWDDLAENDNFVNDPQNEPFRK
jgi:hypothetical protein